MKGTDQTGSRDHTQKLQINQVHVSFPPVPRGTATCAVMPLRSVNGQFLAVYPALKLKRDADEAAFCLRGLTFDKRFPPSVGTLRGSAMEICAHSGIITAFVLTLEQCEEEKKKIKNS